MNLLYVGSTDGMEGGLVARESGIPFVGLPAAALKGRSPLQMARNSLVLLRGVAAARRLIRERRPAAILGTGGYVCVPLFVAAALERVPTLLYLPDIIPGLAGRVLAKLATKIGVTFEDSRRYLPARKVIATGYPVRAELFETDRAAARAAFGIADDLPALLVYGGSRGARSINRAIQALLPDLVQWSHILHVCGREGDEAFLRDTASQLAPEVAGRYQIFPYLHAGQPQSMGAAFRAADLAVCRAGASTMAELPAAGLGAVLIPLVHVHQDANARALASRGAAVQINDDELLGAGAPIDGPLGRQLKELLTDHAARRRLAERSAALAQPDAGLRLAAEWLRLARGV
ncbi:MAG TPA: UDP-N-acetylglucosamine--N-acetylmuramyl-(pentapeptide) pyrophosphoryl-undecaprenol N-acetylglucosamine transferase [Herpetosiphonaceae bacterium]